MCIRLGEMGGGVGSLPRCEVLKSCCCCCWTS